jgi:hypothetical protein
MNYKIIHNEQALLSFIDFLPECLPHEQYYITLFARKKYNDKDSNLTADKNQLKRVTATKDRIIEKIKQMECAVGAYTYKGMAINQNNLALYISPNPRDFKKASMMMLKTLVNNLEINDFVDNTHSMAMNCIQVSHGRRILYDIDVDFNKTKDFDECTEHFKQNIVKYLNPEAINMVRTNGGIHCLVCIANIDKKIHSTWHKGIKNMGNEYYDITMWDKEKEDDKVLAFDTVIPVVGCNQGANNFAPYMIYL